MSVIEPSILTATWPQPFTRTAFCVPLQSRRGASAKGSGMFALESQPTDAWWGECFVCAGEMRIMLIEPHPISAYREKRTFEYTRCGRTRVYTVDLT